MGGKIPWRRSWQPTPVFLPGESHGQRNLVGYSPRGRKESDMTEWLSTQAHMLTIQSSSVQFSSSVVSDSLRPHESQHARPPCPSPSPGVHSNLRPSSRWCYPAISSSVVRPLFLLPPIPPSIRVFSNESTLHMRWPKYWSWCVFVIIKECLQILYFMQPNETPVLWPPHVKSWLIGKDSDAGTDWGQEEKGITEDEMAGWYHRLDGRESQWILGVGDGQGGLACCDSWGLKELDTTERLNWTELNVYTLIQMCLCIQTHSLLPSDSKSWWSPGIYFKYYLNSDYQQLQGWPPSHFSLTKNLEMGLRSLQLEAEQKTRPGSPNAATGDNKPWGTLCLAPHS